MKNSGRRILAVPMRKHFRGHSFLEEVYTKILPARGWEVTWYVEDLPAGESVCQQDWNGTRVLCHPGPEGGRNPLRKIPPEDFPLVKLLATGEFDLLQVRNFWRAAQACRGVCRENKIPIVFQRNFPREDYRIQDAMQKQLRLKNLRIMKLQFEKKIAYREIGKCDWIFPVSDFMMEEMAGGGVPADKMTPMHLGFNCSVKPDDVDGAPVRGELELGDRPVALYLGSMAPQRHLGVMVRAFAEAAPKSPGAALIMLGGRDYPEQRQRLINLSNELGVGDRIIFRDHVPREEVYRYIRASDFTVSPIPDIPSYRVSSPTKVMESLALGRPALVTELPDQSRIIRETGAGLSVPFEEKALSDAMIKMFSDRGECARMGAGGRDYIEKHRDYNHMADIIEEIYEKLIRGMREK